MVYPMNTNQPQQAANPTGLSSMYSTPTAVASPAASQPPSWMDSYNKWNEQDWWKQQQSAYGGQIDRPWNSDDGSRQAKDGIDSWYKTSLDEYNKANGTNFAPDQSVLGADAQPNQWNQKRNTGPGVINGISDAVSHAGQAIANSPLAMPLLSVGGALAGIPPWMTASVLGANAGTQRDGELGKGVLTGLGSYGIGTGLNSMMSPTTTGSSAFGGGDSFANANAVGANDLAIQAMPEVTAGSLGLPEAAGGGLGELLGGGGMDAVAGFGADAGSSLLGGAEATAGGLGGASMSSGGMSVGTGAATGFASSNVGKVIGSILGNSGGIRDLAQAAGTLWSAGKGSENATNNQNAINGQIKSLSDMFGQDSPYAKMLRQTLERKDAAAGRNSQYGNRETQLQALLAEKALQSSGAIGNLAQQSSALDNNVNAGRNTQLNALDSILNKTGVYDWTTDWMKNGLGSLFGG